MLTRRIVDRLRAQDWTALFLELAIVIIGIFIAIQVDRWWADRDRQEREVTWLWDNVGIVGPWQADSAFSKTVAIDSVRAAAERLSKKRDFVAWLPEARGMQSELMDTHGRRLEKALALLAILRGIVWSQDV